MTREPQFEVEKQASSRSRFRFFPLLAEIKSWTRDIFFAAVTAVLIVVFVVQPVRVEGTSMQPNLADQERIFVNKFVYRFTPIERNDVVVFWYPRDRSKSFIKRVVGLPGETLEVRDGHVFVNGRQLTENYVRAEYLDHFSYPPVTIPRDSYFVMGDHRNSSNDSRHWGCVPDRYIFGKAIFRYWPFSRIGLVD